jgi:chain length determinant protein tyrosine kinase EpsG
MHRDIPNQLDAQPTPDPGAGSVDPGTPIGDIIRRFRNLDAPQVESILAHQRDHGTRFGESAVALGLASDDDVVYALSQQFSYPYAPAGTPSFNDELVVASRPFSPQAEAFRGTRAQLLMRLNASKQPRRALAVISANSGDGKTYFAANIATAFSQLRGRTLLIDGDLRNPRLHQLFGVGHTSGLSNVLSGRSESQIIHAVPHLPNLFVLPVGTVPPNPLELLEGPGLSLLLDEVVQKFDHVVIDTPAFSFGMDGPVIAAKCGAAVVVARRGFSQVDAIRDLIASVSESPAELAGVILNEF